LSCSVCHKIDAMNTLDPKTMKVTLASCADCHVTATADDGGALNVEIDKRKANPSFQCSKCHVTYGKAPIPLSHANAIPAVKAK
jgi:nitrate/TMAO reductase-like tetraheme cytochrome c subunit